MWCQECGTQISWDEINEMIDDGYDVECLLCGSEDLDLYPS